MSGADQGKAVRLDHASPRLVWTADNLWDYAGLESGGNDRCSAPGAGTEPIQRDNYQRCLGLSAGQLWIPKSALFSIDGQFSGATLHRHSSKLQLLYAQNSSRASRGEVGRVLPESTPETPRVS